MARPLPPNEVALWRGADVIGTGRVNVKAAWLREPQGSQQAIRWLSPLGGGASCPPFAMPPSVA
eukprot:157219-Prymnesium_polylepis.1